MAVEDNSISVISSDYCFPLKVELEISVNNGITYINGRQRVFRLQNTNFGTLHRHCPVLYDLQGNPILTLYRKTMTLHSRCKVYRGKGKDKNQKLFKVKRSSIIQSDKIKLDVFLAGNPGRVSDFRVDVSSSKNSCVIEDASSSKIIAQMINDGCLFKVSVEANVDYAFITALLLIVREMNDQDSFTGFAKGVTVGISTALTTTASVMSFINI